MVGKKRQNLTKFRLSAKQKLFISEYIQKLGHITHACAAVGISRKTYYDWLKDNKRFEEEFTAAIEHHNDAIQSRILSLAMKKDKDMLKFWAKTQMKHRGFTEKSELSVGGMDNITINITEVKKK